MHINFIYSFIGIWTLILFLSAFTVVVSSSCLAKNLFSQAKSSAEKYQQLTKVLLRGALGVSLSAGALLAS